MSPWRKEVRWLVLWWLTQAERLANWTSDRRAGVRLSYLGYKNRNRISKEDAEDLFPDDRKCAHCGGWHQHACPRIKNIKFVGENVTEVEFWKHGEWPLDQVVFPWQKAKLILEK